MVSTFKGLQELEMDEREEYPKDFNNKPVEHRNQACDSISYSEWRLRREDPPKLTVHPKVLLIKNGIS